MPCNKQTILIFLFLLVSVASVKSLTFVTGCTETPTLIQCSGSLTGNIINNTDPARNIIINNSVIDGTSGNVVLVNSTGIINVTSSHLKSFGSAGSAGSDTSSCGITGGTGTSGGNGRILIYSSKNIIIDKISNLSGYGGAGGRGGDSSCSIGSGNLASNQNGGNAGDGGTGFINISADGNLTIDSTTNIFSYGGVGGLGGSCSQSCPRNDCLRDCTAQNGGIGGSSTLILSAGQNKNIGVGITINNNAGSGGMGGTASGCGDTNQKIIGTGGAGGTSTFIGYDNILNITQATATYIAGSGGASGNSQGSNCVSDAGGGSGTDGTSRARYIINNTAFLNAYTVTGTSPASGFHIINFTGFTPKLYSTSAISPTHFIYCPNALIKLIYFVNITSGSVFNFNGCNQLYNATSRAEFNNVYPFFSNNFTNATNSNPIINDSIQFRIDVQDNLDIDSVRITNNLSGIFVNESIINLSTSDDLNTTIYYNLTNNLSRFNVIGIQIWANDTGNWINISDIFTIEVKNSLPTLSVSLDPSPIQVGQNAICNPAITDKDGDTNWKDNITIWLKNGVENLNAESYNKSVFMSGNYTTNDKIQCKVSAFDGYGWSANYSSLNVTVGDTQSPLITNVNVSQSSYTVVETVNISATITDSSSSFDFVRVTVNATNYTMTNLGNNIFSYSNTFGIGDYNITYIYARDSSGNLNTNNSFNVNFAVTTVPASPSGSSSSSGAGGAPIILLQGDSLSCSNAGINYTIQNIQGSSVFGYSLITDYGNTRERCKDITLINKGTKNLTISLECQDAGENYTSGFCDYITIPTKKIIMSPNAFDQKTAQFCVKPLDENINGELFFFSIKATDENKLCSVQLNNQVEVSSFFAKFISWRKSGSVSYPLIIPAILSAIFVFFLIYFILKMVGSAPLGTIFGFLLGMLVFISFLLLF